jgi:nicotinamidase-related amidase
MEHNTVENIGRLFIAARDLGYLVFISPHYYYDYDQEWEIQGTLEKVMHDIDMFDRVDPLSLEGFEGSGADWLEIYKEYIAGDNVIVVSPHKIYGPEQNDLALQMRKRHIDRVVLAGMSANLCVEAHMRELIEDGFEVSVVSDATAGAIIPGLGDGYESAMTNFRYIASAVVNTTEAITAMGGDPSAVFPMDGVQTDPTPVSSRMALVFRGEVVPFGTLDDVNVHYGTDVTPEMAFRDDTFAADFGGCVETPMLDPEDGIEVGIGIECFWSIEGGAAVITFFDFGEACGLLVHAGFASVGGFAPGVGVGPVIKDGPNVDTISGSAATDGSNTIVVGQGAFSGVTGNVRLSGALHLGTQPNYANCFWEVELDQTPSCGLSGKESSSFLLTDIEMIAAAKAPLNIEDSINDGVIIAEEKVLAVAGHALVKFHGMATPVGEWEDANGIADVEFTLEDAFDEDQMAMLGDSLGCHSMDMVDLLSEEPIGTGIDCLWGIDGGVAAISYYITDIGVIVNSGLTTVVPFTEGVGTGPVLGDPNSPDGAAMTASFPPATDAHTLVKGSGMYEGFKGNIRLAGIVTPGAPFYFNCIWDISLTIVRDEQVPMEDDEVPSEDGSSGPAISVVSFFSAVVVTIVSSAYSLL